MTNSEALEDARRRLAPFVEMAAGFSGWTLAHYARELEPTKPWDYIERSRKLTRQAASVLDTGTGGGERFGEILEGFRGRAVATEEWEVNAPIAGRLLSSMGCDTVQAQSVHLPFRAASFDVILNRHEEVEPAEIARVLKPGGRFLTQQVWRWMVELREFFPRKSDFGDHFHLYQEGFEREGMKVVDAREHLGKGAWAGLGELVYNLCVAPWEIPEFDPLGSDLEALLEVEGALLGPEGIVMSAGSYILEAVKPPA